MRANVQEICYNLTMRRVRITYTDAYHHVMNRGYAGNPIFAGNVTKSHFLDYLESAVTGAFVPVPFRTGNRYEMRVKGLP